MLGAAEGCAQGDRVNGAGGEARCSLGMRGDCEGTEGGCARSFKGAAAGGPSGVWTPLAMLQPTRRAAGRYLAP